MSKEMTDTEIEEINKLFETPNAFTKWKFMQTPHFDKLPDAVRYTVEKECLTHYFNILTDGYRTRGYQLQGIRTRVLSNG
jgi:hypothetical protein